MLRRIEESGTPAIVSAERTALTRWAPRFWFGRIHDAVDAKLERRVIGEIRRDLGRGIPVRCR